MTFEQDRRRRVVDAARHSSEMEGGHSDQQTREDQEAYVRGELSLEQGLEQCGDGKAPPTVADRAIDRLTSGAHTLIIEGPSHRQRQHVTVDETSQAQHAR